MNTEWYYIHDGQEYGPVSAARLHALAQLGQLLPSDHLWKEGMEEWKPAADFPIEFPAEESVAITMTPVKASEEDGLPDEDPPVVPQEASQPEPQDGQVADGPFASLDFNKTRKNKKQTGSPDSPFVLQANTGSASPRKATLSATTYAKVAAKKSKDKDEIKKWLLYGGGALLCLIVIATVADNGSRGRRADGGGSRQDTLAGCPRGASGEYKAGWERAIKSVHGYHEHLLQFRKRVDSGALVEKHLATEMKTMHDWVDNHVAYLREAARESGQDGPRGEADGYEYGMRRIIKSRY